MSIRITRRELKLSQKVLDEFSKAFEEIQSDDPRELLKIDPTMVGKIATRLFFIDYFVKNNKAINIIKALKSSVERLEKIRKEEISIIESLKKEDLVKEDIDLKNIQAVEIENGKIIAITKDNERIEIGNYEEIIKNLKKKKEDLKPAGPERVSKDYIKKRKKELEDLMDLLKKLKNREEEEKRILENMKGYLRIFADVFSHLERFDEDLFILNTALLAYYTATLLKFLDFLEEIGKKDDFLKEEENKEYLSKIIHNLKEQKFEEKIQTKMAIVEKEERGVMFRRRLVLSKKAMNASKKAAEILERYLRGKEI